MSKPVGVTIAVGAEYEGLAQQAVERFRRFTGCDVVVLNDDHFRASGLRHPSQLKFRLLDLVNAEQLVYFDADAFVRQPWNVTAVANSQAFCATRAFWFEPWVERLGQLYGFGDRVVCSGVMLVHRKHHGSVLRLAEQLQPASDEFLGHFNAEEIAISTALHLLKVPIQFLERRFNWVQYGRGDLHHMANVVVAHACDPALRRQLLVPGEDTAGVPPTATASDSTAWGARTYIYDRLGYDLRPMTLRSDGTISEGGGNAERFWYMADIDGEELLVIGAPTEETCRFRCGSDGVWRGRWIHHEQMPVTLTVHRAQVLIDAFQAQGRATAKLRGVEIGVFRGETSALLLRHLPGLSLYMVDPWRVAQAESDYWLTNAGDATMNQAMFDEALTIAEGKTAFAAHRRTIVPTPSTVAAHAGWGPFDLIFIDGDHSASGIRNDLEGWWPQLAPDGLFAGHDYGNPNFPDVKTQVDAFADEYGLDLRVMSDLVWIAAPKRSTTVE